MGLQFSVSGAVHFLTLTVAALAGAIALSAQQTAADPGGLLSDQTGLRGRYTIDLDFPFLAPRPADPTAPPEVAPSLVTAIQEQWGLKVVPGKRPFRLVVVENAQMPAAN